MWQSAIMGGARGRGGRLWFASGHHPTRRDGALALVLFFLPATAGLVLAGVQHHLGDTTVTVLVSVALGLPVLWLTWATYRESRAVIRRLPSLAEVADQVAAAVRDQWEAEAAVRRLNDPYPLPVSWVTADAALIDGWDVLVTLASSGAGWPAQTPAARAHWAAGPDELAGCGNQLAKILDMVPTRRLVVLGEPGSGKTMLMIRLVLDLLAARTRGGPVPVLVSLASWDVAGQDLHAWMAARLPADYPALSEVFLTRPSLVAELVSARLILPLLDGLDEMPAATRAQAVARISDALRPGEPVVLTCRTNAYRETVRQSASGVAALRAAGAIELRPLDGETVSDYLVKDAGGPDASARWAPVLAALGTAPPVGEALVTPLMAGLARMIYNPRPGESAVDAPDPAELCSLPTRGQSNATCSTHSFPPVTAVTSASAGGNRGTPRPGWYSSPVTLSTLSTALTSPGGSLGWPRGVPAAGSLRASCTAWWPDLSTHL
jgi:hypothetical protein